MSAFPAVAHAPAARSPIKVLVADDSAVVRGLVSRWLGEAGHEVVATAPNGRAAVDALARCNPDVVLLDIEMPELDGIQALPLMLAKQPGIQVVMMSTLTQRNADVSLRCLALGAVDYIPKPESNRGVTTSDGFRNDLIERIRVFGAARARRRPGPTAVESASSAAPAAPAVSRLSGTVTLRPKPRTVVPPRALLIGSSTGGPRAVGEVLEKIGAATLRRLPVLIVQHMPPVFTAVFAEHLGARIGLPAAEGKADERLQPGRIYVAPGGRHMRLAGSAAETIIRLDDGPPVNFCRPAVDVMFLDAAALYGGATLSVILTGMGSDGTAGSRALVEAGGILLAQDEATSTVWGMPGSVAKAGLCHAVLPLPEIGPALRNAIAERV
ncbi:MAG: chemotaxis response regulator protein-glutamate methylesterase [Methylobacteriaceae bacterium]|jgi:two-component system chemotaxis response regulator CheB|uniref:Protein-glutamate methylesterase/protein-glutamine glutaminase n=2 Tax=Methylorubrum extorquens TaxID=408 RepID=C7C9K4_METED|nr:MULTISPECIES: chemotaxis response regulator protein-glutamate methylesterase [Methylobacteriaceae]KQO85139.1 two-component system response regulator protein-glutamate methylesterase [Methylobacterium sp. Leaf90]KQO87703.1 two-component system response regulator protein-glutamate methylesterase [Methylobacterium sp. Leaf92]KQP92590.1 two-component system response regulator protein-glutamate methylesterase [Methylobacterium sp. Leaf119]MBA9069741.1 two-component system chemotaxis response regu